MGALARNRLQSLFLIKLQAAGRLLQSVQNYFSITKYLSQTESSKVKFFFFSFFAIMKLNSYHNISEKRNSGIFHKKQIYT